MDEQWFSAQWAVVQLINNTTADMNRLMDLGVDGDVGDYPTRLRTVVGGRGLRLPKRYELKD